MSIIKSLLPNDSSRFESIDDFYKSITKEKLISHEEIKKEEIKHVLQKKVEMGLKRLWRYDLKLGVQDEVIERSKDPESFKDVWN